jgi:hypothetical protein
MKAAGGGNPKSQIPNPVWSLGFVVWDLKASAVKERVVLCGVCQQFDCLADLSIVFE